MKSLLVLILTIAFKFSFSQNSVLTYAFSTKSNYCKYDIDLPKSSYETKVFRLYADSTFIININTDKVNGSCWNGFKTKYAYQEKGTWSRRGKYIYLHGRRDGKYLGWHRYIEANGGDGTLYEMFFNPIPTKLYALNQDCIAKFNELDNLKKKVNIQ